MRHGPILAALLLLLAGSVRAAAPRDDEAPRLVVIVSIDQMRGDYLERFGPLLGDDGFHRLLSGGASFPNAAYTHTITETGPGHAAIGTGCVPARSGIVSNYWYDAEANRNVYCCYDPDAGTLGVVDGIEVGKVSAMTLKRPTLGDLMKAHLSDEAGRPWVVSLAWKDRAALLMAGTSSNGSFWVDEGTGTWITTDQLQLANRGHLQSWLDALNRVQPASGIAWEAPILADYAGVEWARAVDAALAADYADPDDAPGEPEGPWPTTTFPHRIPTLAEAEAMPRGKGAVETISELVRRSPFGDRVVLHGATSLLDDQHDTATLLDPGHAVAAPAVLGRDGVPDLLCLGFSALDYVGHDYGPDSVEVMEMVLELDEMLAELMDKLDHVVGTGRWTLALSADHGVAPLPRERGLRFGGGLLDAVDAALTARFGEAPAGYGPAQRWALSHVHPSLYLNTAAIAAAGLELHDVAEEAARALEGQPGVAAAMAAHELDGECVRGSPLCDLALDVDGERNGEVLFLIRRFDMIFRAGSTHGTHHDYDTRVPLIFYGAGIRPGRHAGPAAPIDLAPTLAGLLGVPGMQDADGRVLHQALISPPHR